MSEAIYFSFFAFALLASIAYALLILIYYKGWRNLTSIIPAKHNYKTKISVLVPARNEENQIKNCIEGVLQQDYPKILFELIIVDDHSTDHTFSIASQYENDKCKVIQCKATQHTIAYKKQAIQEAIEIASGELIVTTDADCRMNKSWLSSIATLYEKEKPKMIVGPVCFSEENTYFEKMQSLEFISLIGSTGSSLFYKKPLMCNGANLAYERKTFLEVNGFEAHKNIATGDDMLLMLHINKAFPNSIAYLKSYEAVVYTHAKKSLQLFWEQRKRWVSKSKYYNDVYVILISLLVYANNFIPLASLFFSFAYPKLIFVFLVTFSFKSMVDYFFLREISLFFKKDDLMKLFIPVQLSYLLYVAVIGFVSNFGSYKWKDRKY